MLNEKDLATIVNTDIVIEPVLDCIAILINNGNPSAQQTNRVASNITMTAAYHHIKLGDMKTTLEQIYNTIKINQWDTMPQTTQAAYYEIALRRMFQL